MDNQLFYFFLNEQEIELLNQSQEPSLQNLLLGDFFTENELAHRDHLESCPQKVKVEEKILRIQCAVRRIFDGSSILQDSLTEDEFIQYLEQVDQDQNSRGWRLKKYRESKANIESCLEEDRCTLRSYRMELGAANRCTTCGKELIKPRRFRGMWRQEGSVNLTHLVAKHGSAARFHRTDIFGVQEDEPKSIDLFKYFTKEELDRALHSKNCPDRITLLLEVERLEIRVRGQQEAQDDLNKLGSESAFMKSLHGLERCCRGVKLQKYQEERKELEKQLKLQSDALSFFEASLKEDMG